MLRSVHAHVSLTYINTDTNTWLIHTSSNNIHPLLLPNIDWPCVARKHHTCISLTHSNCQNCTMWNQGTTVGLPSGEVGLTPRGNQTGVSERTHCLLIVSITSAQSLEPSHACVGFIARRRQTALISNAQRAALIMNHSPSRTAANTFKRSENDAVFSQAPRMARGLHVYIHLSKRALKKLLPGLQSILFLDCRQYLS